MQDEHSSGAGHHHHDHAMHPPEPAPPRTQWHPLAEPTRAVDPDPRAKVVAVDLVACAGEWEIEPGRRVRALTYNGSVPGPVIEANVGDTLVVRLRNELDEPTTIHWHGLRVPAAMDGAIPEQAPVPPGGSFEYRFELLDEGTYWYHPHIDEPRQMEHGLYGAIVVHGPNEPRTDVTRLFVLDDLKLEADGQIAAPGGMEEIHSGRQGPLMLVNGLAGAEVEVRAGTLERWRIVNAASARTLRLALPGHRFTIIGTDRGLLPAPREATELLLVVGDRVDVVVTAEAAPGSTATLVALPYDRGHGAGSRTTEEVLRLRYSDAPPVEPRTLSVQGTPVEPLDIDGITPQVVTFDEIMSEDGKMLFRVNREVHSNVTPVVARVGETQVWDLVNESGMDHPFHLHGFFFQVLSRNGVAERDLSWEDTINLRGNERVRIAFRPEGRPGVWMFHCHILEHIANGMMGHLVVEDPMQPMPRPPDAQDRHD